MAFSPQLFLSNISAKDGLAKPSRFEIILPIPTYISKFVNQNIFEQIYNLPNNIIANISAFMSGDSKVDNANPSISRYLGLQCESAELPGKTLLTNDVKIYGPTFKVPYQSQYSDSSLTFLCTNDFYERKLFERWIEAIHPSDTNNLRYSRDNETRYMTTIKIIQYDEFIKQIFAVELIDAFPIGIGPQPLAWSEDGFHRLTVQFAYQRYRVIYDGEYDISKAIAELFGTKMAPWFDEKLSNLSSPLGTIFNAIK